MRKSRKKWVTWLIVSAIIALSVMIGSVSLAATDLSSEVYLAQQGSSTCTLASAAMMIRARFYKSNNSLWKSVTESSIRSKAWIEGSGLRHSWSYSIDNNSVSVAHSTVSGISVSSLKSLLNSHPEGIVLYCGKLPHAVFLTDYDGSTFYCADPIQSYSGKRISLAASYLGKKYGSQAGVLNNVTAYWYISSYKIGNDAHDPIGYLDSYSGGEGLINISGWARDDDAPNTGIEIHVYIGAPAGGAGAEGHSGIYANKYRSDVGNHGYSATIKTNKTGNQNIYVYAINVGGGNNVLIATGSVKITPREAPKISNVKITDLSSSGYTVSCNVSDNVGIASVKFATWTTQNGQDDLTWQTGSVSGGTARCRIDVKDHNNEINCVYITHVYVDDTAGNSTGVNVGEIYVDSIPPVISDVKVTNVNTSGFDVSCKVYDNHKISKVKCPTWTRKNWQDDLAGDWQSNRLYDGKINGNIVSYHVNTKDHNNETGVYVVHIYAYDECGNLTVASLDIQVAGEKNNMNPVSTSTYNGHTYMLFERTSSEGVNNDKMHWQKVAAYCRSLGGTLACITSAQENKVVASMVSSYGKPCWIGGNSLESVGKFVWETGEAFSYTNWNTGEPNNKGGNQRFIRMYPNGLWDDYEDDSYAFICEFGGSVFSINDATITLSQNTYVYDGLTKTPSIVVKYKGNVLKKDADYTVSYSNNVNAGTAKIIISGKGSYSGSVARTFKIEKAEQKVVLNPSIIKVKEKATVKLTVTAKGTVNYNSNDSNILEINSSGVITGKKAGVAIISITASGNENYKSSSTEVTVTVDHVYNEVIVRDATCMEEGEKTAICSVCGIKQEGSTKAIPKLNHVWNTDYTIDKEASCTEKGEKSLHCSVCDEIKEDSVQSIPETGHQNTELRNKKEATCTAEGYTGDIYCKDCGAKLQTGKAIAKKAHTWDAGKIMQEATCAKTGIKTYTCTVCKTTKTEEVPATGNHKNTELRNAKEATCATEGYTGDAYCKDCGAKLQTGKAIAKKSHIWDAGKITQEATCVKTGIKTYTCTVCKTTKTEEVLATGVHKNTELRNVKEATCTEEGYTGDTYCKDCGSKIASGQKISKTEHTWNSGVITTSPTCVERGVKIYTCNICQTTRTEELPATGNHQNTELRNAKEATCTAEGYTGDIYCKDCGTKLQTGKAIAKKAHTWDVGTVTKAATCTEAGIKTYTCTLCAATKTEELPATGNHECTELRDVREATCAEDGYTGDLYCRDCGTKLQTGKTIAKKAHTWDAGVITTPATCTEKGVKTYTCTSCGGTKTNELPSTGHKQKEVRNKKAATCMQSGYTGDTYCKDCGKKLSSGKAIAKRAHKWDAGVITQEATCTETGIKTYTCTVCESTRIEELPANGHGETVTKFAKQATCKAEGYTGDLYCKDCGELLEEGSVIAKLPHKWDAGKITKKATTTTTGIRTYTCTKCGATKKVTIPKVVPKKATPGKTVKDTATNGIYKVLSDGLTVTFVRPAAKRATVRIPETVKVSGVTCKVTEISANAFKNNAVLKTVIVGKNVNTIGVNAFYGCKNLTKVSGGAALVTICDRAFSNCAVLSGIVLPSTVKGIGKQAFYNCKKLRSITINTLSLTSKNVGVQAFTGTYAKAVVKVPAKKFAAYKSLLRARGINAGAIYRK